MFSTRAFLNNGEVTADFDTIIRKPLVAKLTDHVSNDQWNGYVSRQLNNQIDTIYRAQGTETGLHFNTSLIKQTGRITSELDLLASAIKYTDSIQLIGDAGASITYEGDNFHTGIYFGRITSRPDVRGLPDSPFQNAA